MPWWRLRDKRRSPRLKQVLKLPMPWLECQNASGMSLDGEILDISDHGFCLRVAQAIEPGTILTLVLKDTEIHAQVKWCRYGKDSGLFSCGVELTDGQSQFIAAIERIWSIGD